MEFIAIHLNDGSIVHVRRSAIVTVTEKTPSASEEEGAGPALIVCNAGGDTLRFYSSQSVNEILEAIEGPPAGEETKPRQSAKSSKSR